VLHRREVKSVSDSAPDPQPRALQEIQAWQIPHLREHFSCGAAGQLDPWDALPYTKLGGPGLERLCFRLLLADRKVPRYFGDNGRAQFGIDLIVSDGRNCTVYQCKNHSAFELAEFQKLLTKFEEEWLIERPGLPKPTQFIIVWPVEHKERQGVEEAKKPRGTPKTGQ
jgi:hypothetical protein